MTVKYTLSPEHYHYLFDNEQNSSLIRNFIYFSMFTFNIILPRLDLFNNPKHNKNRPDGPTMFPVRPVSKSKLHELFPTG